MGDKYNCTLCDSNGATPALFTDKRELSGKTVVRSTCFKTCPTGFFYNINNSTNIVCSQC